MFYIIILVLAFLGVLIYWFRERLDELNAQVIILWITSLLWGIFSATVLLFFIQHLWIQTNLVYASIIWPILEELVKFIIIYLIISTLDDEIHSPLKCMAIWILVGLGFGIYENIIYIWSWITDIKIILFRSIFVWGLMLHPLTCAVYGYMIWIARHLPNLIPHAFNLNEKSEIKNPFAIWRLMKMIYKSSDKSKAVLADFIKRIFLLDATIRFVLNDKPWKTTHWHWPVEIIWEAVMMWIWLHILYNTTLSYISWQHITLQIVAIAITILLLQLFQALVNSKVLWAIMALIIISWFLIQNSLASQILILSLVIIMIILLMLSWKIEKKINLDD